MTTWQRVACCLRTTLLSSPSQTARFHPAQQNWKVIVYDSCSRDSRFDFVLADNFLSAFPPIDSLLSPPGPAVSLDLSPSSLPKCNQLDETNPLPRRDNSPLIKASAFNLVMDSAALFSFANASPPRYSPVCKAYRSPLGIINKSESVERKNTKSPLPTFQSSSLIID